jgi:hypothetical protein
MIRRWDKRPIHPEYQNLGNGKLAGTSAQSYRAGHATGGSKEAVKFKKRSAGPVSQFLLGAKSGHTASSRPCGGTFPHGSRQKAENDESNLTADKHHQAARKNVVTSSQTCHSRNTPRPPEVHTPKHSNANKIRNHLI